MSSLTDILAKIREQKTVVDGISVLIQDLKAAIEASKQDQLVIDSIFLELEENTTELAANLVANTEPPVEEEVPPVEEEVPPVEEAPPVEEEVPPVE